MLPSGTALGPYQVLTLLGKGGMGEVYLARDTRLGRNVAVKVIAPDLARDRNQICRFEQEARAAGALDHPNVCVIHDIGVHEQSPFVVMELLEGESLRARLMRGPIPACKAIDYVAQAANGLAAAHDKGIVHRDLKPENLFLTKDGRVKILDFGLAKLTRPDLMEANNEDALTINSTRVGAVMGTAGYMSPEQVRGRSADHRSDLFSLGAVLYELLTGRRAFPGATIVETSHRIVHEEPPPLADSSADIPFQIESIIRHCLEKDPNERFQTARDLSFNLRAAFDGPHNGSVPDVEASASGAASPAGAGRSQRRRAAVAVGLLAVVVLSIVWNRDALVRGMPWLLSDVETIAVAQEDQPGIAADVATLRQGVVANLTDGLCQIAQVSVLSNTGAPALQQRPLDIDRIRKELGADALVTVGVVQTGLTYEVRVALIETRTRRHLWGGVYKRKSRDIAGVVESVGRDVTDALQLRLSVADQRRLDAYRIYQKARYYWDQRSADGLRKAVEYYGEVIRIDPAFAPAHAGLANCYSLLSYYGGVSPAESFPKAEAAARKALEMDEGLAEAHTALALVLRDYRHEWAEAEREFRRAIELDPVYATAQQWYAEYLAALGRYDEAIQAMRRARDLAPLEPIISADLGWVYYLARRPDDAIAQLTETIEREPEFAPAHWFLSLAYAQKGLLEQALASADLAVKLSGGSTRIMADRATLHARAGDPSIAVALLETLRDNTERGDYVSPYEVALLNVGLGRSDRAFILLDQAVRDRRWELVNLQVDPMLDPLRSDKRFADLVRRMGFPQ